MENRRWFVIEGAVFIILLVIAFLLLSKENTVIEIFTNPPIHKTAPNTSSNKHAFSTIPTTVRKATNSPSNSVAATTDPNAPHVVVIPSVVQTVPKPTTNTITKLPTKITTITSTTIQIAPIKTIINVILCNNGLLRIVCVK